MFYCFNKASGSKKMLLIPVFTRNCANSGEIAACPSDSPMGSHPAPNTFFREAVEQFSLEAFFPPTMGNPASVISLNVLINGCICWIVF
jgi:hypothetical protein